MRLKYMQNPDDSPYRIVLPTTSHVPLFLSVILVIASKTLCSSILSQWFFVDTIRRTTEALRSTFDYCLSSSCSTTSIKRARSLSRLIKSAASLISQPIGVESALSDMIYCLMLCRLQEGPRPGWENVDIALCNVFEAKLNITHTRRSILVALDILRTENWGDEGRDLRVGLSAFVVPTNHS